MQLRYVFEKKAEVHLRERKEAEASIYEGGAHNIPSHFAIATGDRVLAGPEEGPAALFDGLQGEEGHS